MDKHIKGINLSEMFYEEEVFPILNKHFFKKKNFFKHSACLIGKGSEILGFDTEMSGNIIYSIIIFFYS